MNTLLMLDALYPPGTPAALVRDLRQVGARAFAGYAYRSLQGSIGSNSAAHVAAVHSAGLLAVPIIVPGDQPPAYATTLDAVLALGYRPGPALLDVGESGTWTPAGWVSGFAGWVAGQGWQAVRYTNDSAEPTYAGSTPQRWRAYYIQHQVPPVPGNPSGGGWQYANQVFINGTEYDASVMNPALWPPPPAPPTEEKMELETDLIPFTGGGPTVQLADQVNTLYMRHYVRVRSTDSQPASGTVCFTDHTGTQGAGGIGNQHLMAPGGGGWADFHLPYDGKTLVDCAIEFIPDADSGPGTISHKVGTP